MWKHPVCVRDGVFFIIRGLTSQSKGLINGREIFCTTPESRSALIRLDFIYSLWYDNTKYCLEVLP